MKVKKIHLVSDMTVRMSPCRELVIDPKRKTTDRALATCLDCLRGPEPEMIP